MNIIELDITFLTFVIILIGLILSIIWNLINTYLNYKNSKRWKIESKYNVRKRALKDLYDYTKDFAKRLEFTDDFKEKDFTRFYYKLKKKDEEGYEEPYKVEALVKKILDSRRYAREICDYPIKPYKYDVEEHQRTLIFDKTFSIDEITIPNEMLPKTPEEIKQEFLNSIINLAKDAGFKEKDLK